MKPIVLADEEVRGIWRGQVSLILRTAFVSGDGVPCPYGAPGDLRWVQEVFALHHGGITRYRAGWPCYDRGAPDTTPNGRPVRRFLSHDYEMPEVQRVRWHPAEEMPRELSRMAVKVTDMRVVNLRDVTAKDAEAAGVVAWTKDGTIFKYAPADEETDGARWPWGYGPVEACPRSALEAFARWQSEVRPEVWGMNPPMWLVSVERVEVSRG